MIVQALCMFILDILILFIYIIFLKITLLDELDKEVNNYIMQCKELYDWHFPESFIENNIAFCKTFQRIVSVVFFFVLLH